MTLTKTMAAVVAGLVAAGAGDCLGQGATHRDRSAWRTTIGGIDRADNFNNYVGDTIFRNLPLQISGGMTLRQVGTTTLHEFRNFIDGPAFNFPDHNGTPHVSCWVDFPEPFQTGVQVEILFERPLAAWGANFWGAASGERLDVVVVSTLGVQLGVMEATKRHSDESEFLGFIAPPGESIGKIVLRSRRRFLGTVGEGFGIDNFALKYAAP